MMALRLMKTCDPQRAEKLERVLRYPGVRRKWQGRTVHIWSGQWDAYWRPKGAGYTTETAEAGRWDIEEAIKLSQHCGPEKQIQFYVAA